MKRTIRLDELQGLPTAKPKATRHCHYGPRKYPVVEVIDPAAFVMALFNGRIPLYTVKGDMAQLRRWAQKSRRPEGKADGVMVRWIQIEGDYKKIT